MIPHGARPSNVPKGPPPTGPSGVSRPRAAEPTRAELRIVALQSAALVHSRGAGGHGHGTPSAPESVIRDAGQYLAWLTQPQDG